MPLTNLYQPPNYDDETKLQILKKSVLTGKINLPALATLPLLSTKELFPMIILIGGSGPTDMDESIGAEKPFKDLSIGLALQGIATLRFNKRTFMYKNLPSNLTINEEYLLDVNSAIKVAKSIPGVDTTKLFILGHSLGGMLSPLILKNNPSLAGAILLEANARPLADLIFEQSVHLSKIGATDIDQKQIQELEKTTQEINQLTQADTDKTLLNISGRYWLSINAVKPLQIAATLSQQKILIIQGGSDYQVTNKDFKLWGSELKNKGNVSFKYYPLINHALVEVTGKFSPDEYSIPLNVPLYLSNDIANWVHAVH